MANFPYARILFLYGGRSREPVNRSQQLARYFAEVAPVTYVPYRSLREWLDREWRVPLWQPLASHPRIEMLPTPPTVFLGRRWRWAGAVTGWLVARRINAALRRHRLGVQDALCFAYTPVAAGVMRHFPDAPLHYDCADDHEHWHGSTPAMGRLNRANEIYLATRAQSVTVVSFALADKMRAYNSNVSLVPNGVEYELFASPANGSQTPADLQGLPRPLIGFIGSAQGYIDTHLVSALASADVGTLVFVGPLQRIEQQLGRLAHIRFLGSRHYLTLPHYLRAFDVTIIPANKQMSSLAANPGKLYQYLAAGKPVVATDLPEFTPFRDVVYIARTTEEFIAQVRVALREPPERRQARQQVAQACSWRNRAEAILEVLRTPHNGSEAPEI